MPELTLTPPTQILDVEVVVTGTASDDDDENVPGTYDHEVKLSRPVVASNLTPGEAGAIAQAVLNSFHDHQGIECLDDFEIVARIKGGPRIEELADEAGHDAQLVKSVLHFGQA